MGYIEGFAMELGKDDSISCWGDKNDEITGLMFASHCFMLGNDRMLFSHVLVCKLGKVGEIVCASRVGTLQVSPKRVHLA